MVTFPVRRGIFLFCIFGRNLQLCNSQRKVFRMEGFFVAVVLLTLPRAAITEVITGTNLYCGCLTSLNITVNWSIVINKYECIIIEKVLWYKRNKTIQDALLENFGAVTVCRIGWLRTVVMKVHRLSCTEMIISEILSILLLFMCQKQFWNTAEHFSTMSTFLQLLICDCIQLHSNYPLANELKTYNKLFYRINRRDNV